MQHWGSIWSADFSPDGKTIAAVIYGQPVRFWDVASNKEIAQLPGTIRGVAYARDGKTLFTLEDDVIRQREIGTNKAIRQFPSLDSYRMMVSPDGRWLTTGVRGGLLFHDLATGKADRILSVHGEQFAFSRNGKLLLAVDYKVGISILETAGGKLLRRLTMPEGYEPVPKDSAPPYLRAAAFAPDGQSVAVLSSRGHLYFFNIHDGKLLRNTSFVVDEFTDSFAFSPDGNTVAAGGQVCKAVYLFDLATGKTQTLNTPARSMSIHNLLYASDGRRLAAICVSGAIQVWDLAPRKKAVPLGSSIPAIHGAALSNDGKRAATWSERGSLQFWDARTGKLQAGLADDAIVVRSALFSADGRVLATEEQKQIRLWDVATRKERLRIEPGRPLRFSPDGKLLAVRTDYTRLRIVDTTTGKTIHTLNAEAEHAAFSSDGKLLAIAAVDFVRVWDVGAKRELRKIRAGSYSMSSRALVFTTDGKELLFACVSQGLRRWDLVGNKELEGVMLEPGTSSHLSADGSILVWERERDGNLVWKATQIRFLVVSGPPPPPCGLSNNADIYAFFLTIPFKSAMFSQPGNRHNFFPCGCVTSRGSASPWESRGWHVGNPKAARMLIRVIFVFDPGVD